VAIPSPTSSKAVSEATSFRDVFYDSADGLRLYARDYSDHNSSRMPVLCLPGLTRSSRDFETVAPHLAQHRRVIAADFRGRGRSHYASDPKTYRPDVELADTITLLRHLQIERVAVIGTSRGGLVALLMAAFNQENVGGILLNDIGTMLEPEGLLRIRSYLGVEREFASWDEAVEVLKASNYGFESLVDREWNAFARRLFKSVDGKPRLDYDLSIAHNFPSTEDIKASGTPPLWELFAAANAVPVAILRGEHSDLLSTATVAAMQNANPQLDATTVAGRGHAPFLDEPESWAAINRWLARVDAGA